MNGAWRKRMLEGERATRTYHRSAADPDESIRTNHPADSPPSGGLIADLP
jgi:hypothetical protein